MNKQLSIQIKLSDAASAGIRQVMTRVSALANTAVRSVKSIAGGIGGLLRMLTSFRTLAIAAFAAIGTGALANSIRRTAQEMDELVKTSRQLGLSAQFLGELKYTADLSGVSFESLSNASARLARSVAEAVDKGAGPAYEAFRGLNVQLRDSEGRMKPMNELLYEITDRFTELENGYKRVQYAQGIFGKGGTEMLRVLALGSPALRQMAEEARRLGAVFSDQELAAAEAFNDSISRIGYAITGLKSRIVGLMGEDLAAWLNKVASGIAAVPEILHNISRVMKEAFSPEGEGGSAAIEGLNSLGASIVQLVESIAFGAVAAASAVVWDGVDAIAGIALDRVKYQTSRVVADIGDMFADLADTIGIDLLGGTSLGALYAEGAKELRSQFSETETWMESFTRRMNEQGSASLDGLNLALDQVAFNAIRVGQEADSLFGISEALAKTALNASALATGMGRVKDKTDEATKSLEEFRNGTIDAFDRARVAAGDFKTLGSNVTTELTQGLSQQLAPEIVNIATAWELSGDRIRAVISNVLRSVAEMITQMLVLRAIVGIGKSFFPDAGAGDAIGGIGGAPSFGGGVFANKGLREVPRIPLSAAAVAMMASVVPQYASGTSSVPGPYTNRDSVLAMLTPRESVLTPRASDMLGRGNIDRLNRGESIGGSGVSITVAPVIHIHNAKSPERTAQAVSREVEAAVLRALATSPSFRQEMRRHL